MAESVAREHIVRISKTYSVSLLIQALVASSIICLLFPYDGPRSDLPGYLRYTCLVCSVTWTTSFYYLVSTHMFPPGYNCWIWLLCCVGQMLQWMICWIYTVYNVGQMASGTGIDTAWSHKNLPKYGAVAGLGALNVLLALGSLVWYSQNLHHHRILGRPYTQYGPWRKLIFNHQHGDADVPGENEPESGSGDADATFIEMVDRSRALPQRQETEQPAPYPARPVHRGETPLRTSGKPPAAYF